MDRRIKVNHRRSSIESIRIDVVDLNVTDSRGVGPGVAGDGHKVLESGNRPEPSTASGVRWGPAQGRFGSHLGERE